MDRCCLRYVDSGIGIEPAKSTRDPVLLLWIQMTRYSREEVQIIGAPVPQFPCEHRTAREPVGSEIAGCAQRTRQRRRGTADGRAIERRKQIVYRHSR